MKAALMHIMVASVWTFLHGNTTLGGFFIGGIASFILLWAFQKVLKCEDYVRRVLAAIVFALHFLRDVLTSNLRMCRLSLTPGIGEVEGSFTFYDVSDLTKVEATLLAHFINLTPGTTVADLTEEGNFILHTFPSVDEAVLEKQINQTLRRRLLAVTR